MNYLETRVKHGWMVALVVLAGRAESSEIRGTVRLEGVKSASVVVGYIGKTADGEDQSNMCGTTVRPGGSGWVQCDTFKPRISRLEFDEKLGGRFRHSKLKPGRYLVYVRAGEHWYDVRWVTLKTPQDSAKVDFRVAPAHSATLEAQVRGAGSQVTCEPVD